MPEPVKSPDAELPSHVEEAVTATVKMALEHHRDVRRLVRWIENVTALIARPAFAIVLTGLVIGWIGLNSALHAAGVYTPDPPPFPLLFDFVALAALYLTGMILSTQRREDLLSTRREELNLQLCILIEQKTAKLLELSSKTTNIKGHARSQADSLTIEMAESADVEKMLLATKTHAKPLGEESP